MLSSTHSLSYTLSYTFSAICSCITVLTGAVNKGTGLGRFVSICRFLLYLYSFLQLVWVFIYLSVFAGFYDTCTSFYNWFYYVTENKLILFFLPTELILKFVYLFSYCSLKSWWLFVFVTVMLLMAVTTDVFVFAVFPSFSDPVNPNPSQILMLWTFCWMLIYVI